jgi:uncharacterized protein
MKHVVRVIAHWALMAHVYVSMAGFTLALLFGLTGLTLNHQEFGFAEPQVSNSVIHLDKALVDRPDQFTLEQCLRQDLGLRSHATDYHEDENQIQVTFAVPGARTVVTIDRADGKGEVEKETRGLLGKLDDLHKGLDAGKVWYSTIDVAALLLITSSLTGIVTMLVLRARRRSGFTVCALGVLTVILIYVISVPR